MIRVVLAFNQDATRLLLRSRDCRHLVSELAELPDVAAEIMGLASFNLWSNKCISTASQLLDYLSLRLDGKNAVKTTHRCDLISIFIRLGSLRGAEPHSNSFGIDTSVHVTALVHRIHD